MTLAEAAQRRSEKTALYLAEAQKKAAVSFVTALLLVFVSHRPGGISYQLATYHRAASLITVKRSEGVAEEGVQASACESTEETRRESGK
jgi:hypothetical protein